MSIFDLFLPNLERSIQEHNVHGIIRALKSGDVVLQRKAAGALGDFSSAEAVPALISALSSTDRDVRRLSAAALGNIRDTDAPPELLSALNDPDPGVRLEVTEALGKIRDPDAAQALIVRCLADSNTDVVMAAIYVLGRLGDTSAVPTIRPLLSHSEYGIRLRAAESLETLHAIPSDPDEKADFYIARNEWDNLIKVRKAAIRPLVRVLQDNNFLVRQKAAGMLGYLKDPQAVLPLIDLLRNDDDVNVRMEAASALRDIGDTRALPVFVLALEDSCEGVRVVAANALERMKWSPKNSNEKMVSLIAKGRWLDLAEVNATGITTPVEDESDPYYDITKQIMMIIKKFGRDAVPHLLKELESTDPEIRRRALFVIGKTGEPTVYDQILVSLKDSDSRCRNAAITALGELADPRAVPVLDKTAREERPLSPFAVRAMGMIQHPEAQKKIISHINDPDPTVRLSAVRALINTGDRTVIPSLLPALSDRETIVRIAAMSAIVKFGGDEAWDLLLPGITDPDPLIRRAAARSLIRLRDSRLPEVLTGMLSDPDYEVCRIARDGLDEIERALLGSQAEKSSMVATNLWKKPIREGIVRFQITEERERKGKQPSPEDVPPASPPAGIVSRATEQQEPSGKSGGLQADMQGSPGTIRSPTPAPLEGVQNNDREARLASLKMLLKKPTGNGAGLVSVIKKETW